MRKADPAALEEIAAFEQTTEASPAFGALPLIAAECLAIEHLQARDDPFLQSG
jgi:hypothetical protein